jgi:hypothetical protein
MCLKIRCDGKSKNFGKIFGILTVPTSIFQTLKTGEPSRESIPRPLKSMAEKRPLLAQKVVGTPD